MMKTVREGFELLDSLGVNREVQQLFSEVLREDDNGRLIVDYRNEHGDVVDREINAVLKHKLSSMGVLYFSPALPENVRTLYISDAVMNLISMVRCKHGRMDFTYAAFLASGAKLEKGHVMNGINHFPKGIKIYTVFGHSLIGRIRDCKVQHWIKGLDCSFRSDGNKVVALFNDKEIRLPVGGFSLRNHLRQIGVRQTLATLKPFDKKIDNFYSFSYF